MWLDAAPYLAALLALGHVAHHAGVSARVAQRHVPLVRCDVLLDRLLKRLTLLLDALLHLVAQLLVDSKVLHLQLHVALLLRVNEIG